MINREKLMASLGKLNDSELVELCRFAYSYNGSCSDAGEYESNDDEFFNNFFQTPMDAVRACYYGGTSYNFNDDYVRFDFCGNLESCNEKELEANAKDCIEDLTDFIIENPSELDLPFDLDDCDDEAKSDEEPEDESEEE